MRARPMNGHFYLKQNREANAMAPTRRSHSAIDIEAFALVTLKGAHSLFTSNATIGS